MNTDSDCTVHATIIYFIQYMILHNELNYFLKDKNMYTYMYTNL